MKKPKNLLVEYKRLNQKTKSVIWLSVLILLILIVPNTLRYQQSQHLRTARLYFTQPANILTPGQIFPIELRLQTTGTATNAVSSYIFYDPSFIEVVSMTTEKSFCTFYLDNSFDNIKGEVQISCGVPNPGFVGDSIVVRMSLRAKASGNTKLKLDQSRSQVLANDGKGSNITQELPELPLTVQAFF